MVLDTPVFSAPMSTSRARRLRGAAVRNRLWTRGTSKGMDGCASKAAVLVSESTAEIDGLSLKLSCLESLVQDLHWVMIGQFHVPYTDSSPDLHDDSILTYFNPDVASFVPLMTSESAEGTAETSAPQEFVLKDHAIALSSAQSIAAIKIQNMYRAFSVKRHNGRNERAAAVIQRAGRAFLHRCELYYDTCASCRRSFGNIDPEGSWQGDACDICGVPTCSSCLVEVLDIKGEWSLCLGCRANGQHNRSGALQCDLRRAPEEFWTKLYAEFQCRGVADETACRDSYSSNETIATDCVVSGKDEDIFKPLDSTLDFILRFLEGEHTKSGKINQSMRDSILKAVRSAMAWKQQGRSREAVQRKVEEMNTMMGRIVNQL